MRLFDFTLRRICLNLLFITILFAGMFVPQKAMAQPGPTTASNIMLNGNSHFAVTSYTSSSIYFNFLHYDAWDGDSYIENMKLQYSTDGGSTWNDLATFVNHDQNTDFWYWTRGYTASTSVNLYYIAPPSSSYGSLGGVHSPGGKISNSETRQDYDQNSRQKCYTALRWDYTNMLSNCAVRFRMTGTTGQNGIGTVNTTWNDYNGYSIRIGNPLSTPSISGHTFNADGTVDFNVS